MELILQVGCSTYVAVVQLEERFPAKEEVIGSNPIGYTIYTESVGYIALVDDHYHSKCG